MYEIIRVIDKGTVLEWGRISQILCREELLLRPEGSGNLQRMALTWAFWAERRWEQHSLFLKLNLSYYLIDPSLYPSRRLKKDRICVYLYLNILICMYVYIYIYAYMYACIYRHTHACMCIHVIYTYMCKYKCKHTYK